jgi:ParB family chromosome partitioning protein
LERSLTEHLGLRVEIAFSGKGGSVRIHYRDLDQLDGLLVRLQGD